MANKNETRDRPYDLSGLRGACHRARIRATRWLHPGYDSCNAIAWSEATTASTGAQRATAEAIHLPTCGAMDCFASARNDGYD